MSFLDNLENNLKALESREEKDPEKVRRDQERREAERNAALLRAPHVEALKNASMADLAMILQFHVDRPVVDKTELKGRYDFKLQWTLDDVQTAAPDAPPELFTAIQEQIGLKLERVRSPADVLVIDKVERPGAN